MSTTTTARSAPTAVSRRGDAVFAGLATGAGLLIMLALAGVAIFLIIEGVPAISASGVRPPVASRPV